MKSAVMNSSVQKLLHGVSARMLLGRPSEGPFKAFLTAFQLFVFVL